MRRCSSRELQSTVLFLTVLVAALGSVRAQTKCGGNVANVPANIKAVFEKPLYKHATWGLRVVDLDTGKALIDLESKCNFFIGSVRKIFSVGALLNEIG